MKKLILVLALLSSSAFAGISGDKILFQKDSTFVSAVYSKSLCLNGDTYEAFINKCFEWRRSGDDKRTCVDWRKFAATQPMTSTRQRCASRRSDRDGGTCTDWITIPFVQSPVKTVTFYTNDDDRRVDHVEIITIPACN